MKTVKCFTVSIFLRDGNGRPVGGDNSIVNCSGDFFRPALKTSREPPILASSSGRDEEGGNVEKMKFLAPSTATGFLGFPASAQTALTSESVRKTFIDSSKTRLGKSGSLIPPASPS
jgi:hypothetical protein